MKFKVGDKVKILKHEAYSSTGAECSPEHTCIGEKGYFRLMSPGGQINIWGLNNEKYWGLFDESELENLEGKEEKVEEEYSKWVHASQAWKFYYSLSCLGNPVSSTPKKRMKLSAIARRMVDANTRTLVKAGYLDNELELTGNGQEALLAILTTANMEALVKEAKKEIRERKDEEEDE